MNKPSRPLALILMIAAPVLWSSAGVVARHIESAGAYEQVFWRSSCAFAFVAAALALRGGAWTSLRTAGRAGLYSGALWAVMFTAFVLALSLTTVANTLVVMSVSPLLTIVCARLLLRDVVPRRSWLAAGVAFAGIVWMFQSAVADARHAAGMLVAMLVPVAAALNFVSLRAAASRVDMIPAVMLGGAFSALVALPLAWPLQASGRDLLLLAGLGVFQLGLPCVLLVIASRTLSATEIALLGLLEVVLGPIWVWLGAGEVPAQESLTGGALVLAALVANELPGLRRRSSAEASGASR